MAVTSFVMPKTIAVSDKTYQKLVQVGKYGDSMDLIISRVLEAAKIQEPQESIA